MSKTHKVEVGTEIYVKAKYGGFHKIAKVDGPGYETHTNGEHWLMQTGAMLTSDPQKPSFIEVEADDLLEIEGWTYRMEQMSFGCTERRLVKMEGTKAPH